MDETKMGLLEQFARLESLLRRSQMRKYGRRGLFGNPHRGQGRVLALLKMQPEIGQKELGFLLDMSKQALAELLGKLEKSGCVTRTQSEKDRRAYIIKLTDKGREALEGEPEEPDDSRDAGVGFDSLTAEEQRTLSGYLGRVIADLEKSLGGDDDEMAFVERMREEFFKRHGFGDAQQGPPWGRRGFGRGEFDPRTPGMGWRPRGNAQTSDQDNGSEDKDK
ncbi:MAG: MarR family transcriptional regulator [Oscillospiraceae bacterium]|jgi:DNA-binding MarR family transcriptional regulator|nr:MarR family transcriptional regulator [Oscillospiraceae bacterium]